MKLKRHPQVTSTADSISRKNLSVALKALIIVAAGACVLSPTLQGSWYGDDTLYLIGNPLLQDPDRLWKAWFDPGSFVEYYPLEQTVQWYQWKLWGLNSAFGYLLSNLILHLTSALLLWHLFSKLGLKLAWLGGLIFAIHPLMVDSVGVSSELKNTLSLPPFLLAMCFYLDFEKSGKNRDYLVSLLMFLVAMLCKITMCFFPFVILLYAWWKRDRITWKDWKAALPFFVISLALGLTTLHAGAVRAEMTHYQSPGPIQLGGMADRVALSGLTLAFYFGRAFFPLHPMPYYPLWPIEPLTPWLFLPWLGIALVIGCCWMRRLEWGRPALFALAFFALGLGPFLGFNQASYMCLGWAYDHFLYLPIIALIGLVVAGLEQGGRQLPGKFRVYGLALLTLALGLLGLQTFAYAKLFEQQDLLWRYNLQYNPNAWLVRFYLAGQLAQQNDMEEAIAQVKECIRINPQFSNAYMTLGIYLAKVGNYPEAIDAFKQSIRVNPSYDTARLYLATALWQTNHPAEAIEQFRILLRAEPNMLQAHFGLSYALAEERRIPEAIAELQTALKLAPDNGAIKKRLQELESLPAGGP